MEPGRNRAKFQSIIRHRVFTWLIFSFVWLSCSNWFLYFIISNWNGTDVGFHASHEGVHAHENKTLAQQLYKDVRILCWIMTTPKNHQKKARHVKRTWGSRCNRLLFMSTTEDPELESIALPVQEGRNNLWAKTKEAFIHIYKHHLDEADWFLKADDDTYVYEKN